MTNHVHPLHQFNYGNVSISVYYANKGDGLPMHEHDYNHATMCNSGSCVVRVKGKELILTKLNQPLDLPANEPHEIEALEDETVFVNVFAQGKY
jgi:quercetin dioxygenase-like cupin family protein